MSDDRMDERLRDYAARWTAARPAPAASPTEVVRDGRSSWVPYAAAAAVVALVAGVAYAVGPRGDRAPVAAPTASPRETVSYPECGEEDVTTEMSMTRDQNFPERVNGTLDLRATRAPCTIPKAPLVEIRGDNLKDLGVRNGYEGDDVEVVIGAEPRRLTMTWSPPFCATTTILVAVVTLTDEVGFKQPLDRAVTPKCEGKHLNPDSWVSARWEPVVCGAGDWEVASSGVTRNGGGDARVSVTAVLRNVSAHFCDVNTKPHVAVAAADGRRVTVSHGSNSDDRTEPGAAPGQLVRARVSWGSYCGPDLGAYRIWLVPARGAELPLDAGDHPVPACGGSDKEAFAYTDWLKKVESPAG